MSTTDPQNPQDPSFPPPPGYAGPAYDAPPPSGMPELAQWPTRVVAWLIDAVISGVPQTIVYAFNKNVAQLVGLAIFIYFQYRQGTTGQTPGKQVMKIRLLREQDGQVVGFGNAVVRAILHIVDALPCGLGFLWPLWDEKKQTFADKIMKTVVVKQ